LSSLPLFLRHDPGARKAEGEFNPITTETGRDILDVRVVEAQGLAAAGTIPPLRVANIRKDALHQATTYLTKTRLAIMLENLNVSGKDPG
jgi:hypothetical protein